MLGAVRKKSPQSGGGDFVQCRHFADKRGKRGSSDADARTLRYKKALGFFEIYTVSERTRRRESIFCDFVRIPLWTAPCFFDFLSVNLLLVRTHQAEIRQ